VSSVVVLVLSRVKPQCMMVHGAHAPEMPCVSRTGTDTYMYNAQAYGVIVLSRIRSKRNKKKQQRWGSMIQLLISCDKLQDIRKYEYPSEHQMPLYSTVPLTKIMKKLDFFPLLSVPLTLDADISRFGLPKICTFLLGLS
jgi:hypothetical protein